MATPPVIDFDELMAPIPVAKEGDTPAGNRSVTSQLKNRVDYFRDGFDPDNPPPPDKRGNKGEPMWKNIENETKAALAKKCKDLEIAGWLTEALLMRFGFAGARDGFRLIRTMWEEAWDRIYPALDPEEVADSIEKRVGRITTLASDGKPFFVMKLRKATLIKSASDESFSLQSIDEGKGNAFVNAHAAAEHEAIVAVRADIEGAVEEVTKLEAAIVAKEPKSTMALMSIRDTLNLALKAVPLGEAPVVDTPGAPSAPGAPAAPAKPATPTREWIYNEVARLATELEKLDPHSPVPMMLKKVRLLQGMKFNELVDVMTAKDNPLEFITPPEEDKK